MRRDATFPERVVWELVRDRRLAGLKFRRQRPIGPFIADFFCDEVSLVLELDGESHDGRKDYDQSRTDYLSRRGIRVFRVGNDDALEDLEAVGLGILRAAGIDVERFMRTGEIKQAQGEAPSP